jgi:DNA-binding transcriptional LysR family regulator
VISRPALKNQDAGTSRMPSARLNSLSVHLRTSLLVNGAFITALPNSVAEFYADRFGLKILPVDLPVYPWPVVLLTLKHRTLSPVVTAFIDCAKAVTKPRAAEARSR